MLPARHVIHLAGSELIGRAACEGEVVAMHVDPGHVIENGNANVQPGQQVQGDKLGTEGMWGKWAVDSTAGMCSLSGVWQIRAHVVVLWPCRGQGQGSAVCQQRRRQHI